MISCGRLIRHRLYNYASYVDDDGYVDYYRDNADDADGHGHDYADYVDGDDDVDEFDYDDGGVFDHDDDGCAFEYDDDEFATQSNDRLHGIAECRIGALDVQEIACLEHY